MKNCYMPSSILALFFVIIAFGFVGCGGSSSATSSTSTTTPVTPLAITAIQPTTVSAGSSAVTVTLSGTGFLTSSVVQVNGISEQTTYINATELQAIIPPTQLVTGGNFQVAVANGNTVSSPGSSANLVINNPMPTVSSINPAIVVAGSGPQTVTIAGAGFVGTSSVEVNGSARNTTFQNASQLQAVLTASDLASPGILAVGIVNPAPGGGISSTASLQITTPQPIPTIQNVSLVTGPQPSACATIQATLTGTNFTYGATVQANGVPLAILGETTTTILAKLPIPFNAAANRLTFTVTNSGSPAVSSNPFPYPAASSPILSLCTSPAPATIYPSSTFSISVLPSEINTATSSTVSLGALPAGITLQSGFPPTIPSTGATIVLKADPTVVPGNYIVGLSGQAGSATTSAQIELDVQSGPPPSFFWGKPLESEMGVPIGGSAQLSFTATANGGADYNITPSLSGLPAGTTATISPAVVIPGQPVTVTISAASNAPVTQNATVTLTGAASASVPNATTTFLVDVTQPPGSLPDNRTDFVPTGGTPYAAAYDPLNNLIFSSNPAWNRIDVINSQTHRIVGEVDIRDPRGVDITPDKSRVWVATGSQQMFSIDTSTLAMTRYQLPLYQGGSWEDYQVYALSDGTVLLGLGGVVGSGVNGAAVWNPTTNALSSLSATYPVARSGDGTHVYFEGANSSTCSVSVYFTATKALASSPSLNERCGFAAVNQDGSRIVMNNNNVLSMYDGAFDLIGPLPTPNPNGVASTAGLLFSPDNSTLYQISAGDPTPVIYTINAATLALTGTAPAMSTLPVMVSETPTLSNLFGVDSSGMLLGIQDFGISFEDSTFFQKFSPTQVNISTPVTISPDAGPLTGGTTSNIYGGYGLTPDVWYGGVHGTASVNSSYSLNTISPPGIAPGPMNLKFLYPDGTEVFAPQSFSYSVYPQYSILSGSSPDGDVPGELSGYGMPADSSGGTVTIGGNTASITTQTTQYPPYTGEPFPSTFLQYTIPQGAPGWADLQVKTPNGTGSLPRAVFYAKSVTDYASADKFTAVLYDEKRQQVYLSAGDHIDVFSMASGQFVSPLTPASQHSASQFTGLALTPDGSHLLAANLLDGSLGVINPDNPADNYAISIAPAAPGSPNPGCTTGPLYVAGAAGNLAFVTYGNLPAPSCPAEGLTYVVNLQAHTASRPTNAASCHIGYLTPPFTDGSSANASSDGSLVVIGGSSYSTTCIYSSGQQTYTPAPGALTQGLGVAVAGDGNVLAATMALADSTGSLIGRVAHPAVEYGAGFDLYNENTIPTGSLLQPKLNAAGSLYYWPYPNYFDIIDVEHGVLRVRFSLAETIQNTAVPLSIDASGRYVFLITDKGLTVVDLGTAPLSIGSLSQTTASVGAQITIRGSGFTPSTVATVGGQSSNISYTDENTLVLTVPSAGAGPQDIVLTNLDGSSYTLQNAVTVE